METTIPQMPSLFFFMIAIIDIGKPTTPARIATIPMTNDNTFTIGDVIKNTNAESQNHIVMRTIMQKTQMPTINIVAGYIGDVIGIADSITVKSMRIKNKNIASRAGTYATIDISKLNALSAKKAIRHKRGKINPMIENTRPKVLFSFFADLAFGATSTTSSLIR